MLYLSTSACSKGLCLAMNASSSVSSSSDDCSAKGSSSLMTSTETSVLSSSLYLYSPMKRFLLQDYFPSSSSSSSHNGFPSSKIILKLSVVFAVSTFLLLNKDFLKSGVMMLALLHHRDVSILP
jgi:hypothetical protein